MAGWFSRRSSRSLPSRKGQFEVVATTDAIDAAVNTSSDSTPSCSLEKNSTSESSESDWEHEEVEREKVSQN